MCNHASYGKCNDPLKLGSISDILSSVKSIFNKIFPNNKIFSGKNDQMWYTNLRAKSSQEIIRRDIKRGIASSNKSKPIGRMQMKNINETLLSINTYASIKKAVYVGTTFNSAGRSGESAYICIDSGAFWDYDDEIFYFSQKEMKVGEEKRNNFVSDSEFYSLDQYWLLFAYYITGGGSGHIGPNNSHANFIFPELYDKESRSKGGASTYITSILKDLMPTKSNEARITAPLLWDSDVTGTSLRRGAARIMVRKVKIQEVVAKTGHDMKGTRESTVWEYMDGDDLLLRYGSTALAGWANPYNRVYPPTLRRVILDEETKSKFESLSSILFDHSFALTKLRNIYGLVRTMLATFLMYLPDFIQDCISTYDTVSGRQSYVLSTFLDKTKDFYTIEEVLTFGRAIREEWEERNSIGTSSETEGLHVSVERLQTECMKRRTENRDLSAQVTQLKEESRRTNAILHNMEVKMGTLIGLISKLEISPTKKRTYSEEAPTIDTILNEKEMNVNIDTKEAAVVTQQSYIVHRFGLDNNKVVAQVTLADLLLLSYSKGFIYHATERGKGTHQNFECYTGVPPVILRSDEARVRNALSLLSKYTTDVRKSVLVKKMPLIDVATWNQERNKIALAIQDDVIDALCEEEKLMAAKMIAKAPKRSASTISTVMGRYDKLAIDTKMVTNKKLKSQMSNFLSNKQIKTTLASSPSSSSSESTSK